MGAIHSLTAEMHTGFLTLAFASIIGVLVCQLLLKYILKNSLDSRIRKLRDYLEPTSYVALFAGVLAIALSAVTGSLAWSSDDLLDSSITRNKILFTAYALILWCSVLFMRWRFKKDLWTSPSLSILFSGLSVIAFALTAAVGSLGAHITQGGSALDPILGAFGIDLTEGFQIDFGTAIIVIIASIVAIILLVAIEIKTGIAKKKPQHPESRTWPGWDE